VVALAGRHKAVPLPAGRHKAVPLPAGRHKAVPLPAGRHKAVPLPAIPNEPKLGLPGFAGRWHGSTPPKDGDFVHRMCRDAIATAQNP
jgi:hypothetical protein